MDKPLEKIRVDMQESLLSRNMESYVARALEMGATRAKIIKVEEIPVDERVTLKCRIPRCFGYGSSAHCPPNTLTPAELRELLQKYHFAVFFIIDVPPEVIVRDKGTIKELIAAYQKVYKIVSDLESRAFYDGHYLAFGFAAGSCRHSFCYQHDSCQALEGKRCRFPLITRPSMEAVGIDVFRSVAAAGWDIYPIGSGAKPQNVTKGTLAGIVIVQ